MKVVVWGILTALTIATTAVAQEKSESANVVLPYCKLSPAQAGSKAYLAGRCIGLVEGITDALALMKGSLGDKFTPLCVDRPKGVSADQAVKVVVGYGDAHPEQLRAPFTVVVALALAETWPCKK